MLLDELLAEESPTADPANAATLVLGGDPAAAEPTGRQAEAAGSAADEDFSLLNLDTTSEMVGKVRAQDARLAQMRAELEELRHVSGEAMGCTEPDVHARDFAESASSRRLARLRAEVVQLQEVDERGEVWGALLEGGADTGCTGEGGFHDGPADAPSELALDADLEACAEIDDLQGELDAARSRLQTELQDLDQLLAECDAVQASWR